MAGCAPGVPSSAGSPFPVLHAMEGGSISYTCARKEQLGRWVSQRGAPPSWLLPGADGGIKASWPCLRAWRSRCQKQEKGEAKGWAMHTPRPGRAPCLLPPLQREASGTTSGTGGRGCKPWWLPCLDRCASGTAWPSGKAACLLWELGLDTTTTPQKKGVT